MTTTEWLRERTEHLDIFLFFCSVSDVLFIGGRGVSDCSVLKYYQLNINYLVNILNECLAAVESTAASSPKPITTYCLVLPSKMVMHNAYISRHFRQTKITRIASDVAENLQLYRVVWFFHPRSSCMTHLMLFSERPPIYASSCMTISGERAKQLDIIAGFLPRHWLYE